MKVSYNWLQEYFEEKLPTPEELGDILTFHAYEIEEVLKVGNDYMIDVDVLPNRSSDSMSHRGIAREIATLLSRKLKYDPLAEETLEVDESEECAVDVEDDSLCHRYAIATIKGVKVGSSPVWLREKLETLGQRSINNVVDATNYVMLNTGQPLHAFDSKKLTGETKKIAVRCAKEGEKITTLTNDEYTLDPSVLLIVDGNSDTPIGIAGVKGGKVAEVDENTTDIIIESAHFDAVSVRKTSQKLKLWTDASTRFQNDPSQHLVGYALADVIELILDIAGGEVEGAIDIAKAKPDQEPVKVTLSQINNLLGTNLSEKDVSNIFDRFEFEYSVDEEAFLVTPPFERKDINIYEDLIEEVGRVYGYEHLKAEPLPKIELNQEMNKEFYYADKVRNILVDLGYFETYGYSFRNKGDYEAITALASDKSYIRTNLSDGMKESLEKNHKNAPLFGTDRVKIFEIGTVFPKSDEHTSLIIGVSGKKTDKILNEGKEILEKDLSCKINENPKEGVIEINFSKLMDGLSNVESYEPFEKNTTKFEPISLYPFVLRDIAVWAPPEAEGDIMSVIESDGKDLLVGVTLFDQFEKEGKTSYAYHLVFQSYERTLTDDEINKIMDKITSDLNKKKGFEVR